MFLRGICKLIVKSINFAECILRNTKVSWSTYIAGSGIVNNCMIGQYCYIGTGAIMNDVHIGNYCSIAPCVKIGGMEHSWWYGSTSTYLSDKNIHGLKTIIEDDVWIGANAIIKQGVKIGRGAVVGAGAVVIKDVSPYSIVVGVPAREIKKRFSDEIITKIESTRFWLLNPSQAKKILETLKYS